MPIDKSKSKPKSKEQSPINEYSLDSNLLAEYALFLEGAMGNYHIEGSEGNDELHGGASNDILFGGFGEDSIKGGDGDDWLNGAWDNDDLWGDAGDDELMGEEGDDLLSGGDGDDKLSGGWDNDDLWGDAGDDELMGDDGDDFLSGGDGDDKLSGGWDNDDLWGDAGDDELMGEEGDDWLSGGHGDDILDGGAGSDYLKGGAGNDLLIFNIAENLYNYKFDFYDGGAGDFDILDIRVDLDNVPIDFAKALYQIMNRGYSDELNLRSSNIEIIMVNGKMITEELVDNGTISYGVTDAANQQHSFKYTPDYFDKLIDNLYPSYLMNEAMNFVPGGTSSENPMPDVYMNEITPDSLDEELSIMVIDTDIDLIL